jgi:hypothetical protein
MFLFAYNEITAKGFFAKYPHFHEALQSPGQSIKKPAMGPVSIL